MNFLLMNCFVAFRSIIIDALCIIFMSQIFVHLTEIDVWIKILCQESSHQLLDKHSLFELIRICWVESNFQG